MKDRTAELLLPPGDFHDLETLIRGRVREIIDQILEEELASGLGASSHERVADRKGYRHGHRPPRKLLTSFGAVAVQVPRGRVKTETGTKEFDSQIVRRYERRTRRLDAALVTSYLMGTNTRKVRLALRPLVEGTGLSRSAISRLVKRLEGLFETWRHRDLRDDSYVILFWMRSALRYGWRGGW